MRDNLLIIVTGRKRVGKSYESLKQLLYYAYVSKNPKKCLIYDVNGEYGAYKIDGKTHNIPQIQPRELIKYSRSTKGEVRRIVPVRENGLPMSADDAEKLLLKTINYFRNGIIMIDDLNKIFGDAMPQRFSSMLCNNAHRGADVILQIQSVGRLLPKLLQNCEIIRFHQQLDDVDDSKGKLLSNWKILKVAQLMVNAQVRKGDKYFFANVYRDEGKIKGRFSPKMLADAIQNLILENPSEINSLMQRRNMKGEKMYSFEESVRVKTKELYEQFNGN